MASLLQAPPSQPLPAGWRPENSHDITCLEWLPLVLSCVARATAVPPCTFWLQYACSTRQRAARARGASREAVRDGTAPADPRHLRAGEAARIRPAETMHCVRRTPSAPRAGGREPRAAACAPVMQLPFQDHGRGAYLCLHLMLYNACLLLRSAAGQRCWLLWHVHMHRAACLKRMRVLAAALHGCRVSSPFWRTMTKPMLKREPREFQKR